MSSKKKMLSGLIKRHPDGFGFFIPDDKEHPDVFVPQQSMKSAMTNDRATIWVEKERDGRFRGEIIKITERSQKRVAGKFFLSNEKFGLIKDEGRGWGRDLKIPIEQSMNAKNGELVEAQINHFPDEGSFDGEVIQVIGDADSALNDIRRVVITQNIPDTFSKATLKEASHFEKNPDPKDFAGRKDLRNLSIVTIDGATAKDFDDAVYTEMTSKGFHLYVAIADVSHYVAVSSAMDREAYERGNSVYFPNFVIPMLPEGLSNGLCSLNPHVPRLALVAEMNFSFTGEIIDSQFYEAVIESQARVTYGQAQELIDFENRKAKVGEITEAPSEQIEKLQHVKENILRCADLAKVLMAKRFKEGSLDLEVAETELVIDGAGEPVDIIRSERLFAHRLIEELMLAANVAVARFLSSRNIPGFYRIHEPPDPQKISLLEKYMHNMGSDASLGGAQLQKRLTRALQEFHGKPESQIIHILTLRSMSQAKYTANNMGHFGLGFEFYTHFTSPIRRYPDLIVHRLIKSQIMPNSRYRLMAEEDLATAGTWLSACEQKAAKAERQIQAIKKARFMKKMVGETFDGMISSVTKFGVFVLLRQFNIDGLVRLDDLGSDNWQFDEENLSLTAKRSGFSYHIGDNLRVTVSLTDIEQGQINFVLEENAETTENSRGQSKKPRPKIPAEVRADNKTKDDPRKKKNRFEEKRSDKYTKPANKSHRDQQKTESRRGQKTTAKNESEPKKQFRTFANAKNQSSNFKAQPTKSTASKAMTLVRDLKSRFEKVKIDPETQPIASTDPYVIKPRYSSLSDYLDQKQKKGANEENSKSKPAFRSSQNRKDPEERRTPQNNSDGVRKARPEKSRRKNKSR